MTNIQAIDLLKGLEQSLDDYYGLNDEGKTAFQMAITALELFGNTEQLPSAQQERKTGKWVHLGGDEWCCDKCGFVITTEGSWEHSHDIGAKYCQNCGAKTEE